jgi:hypothetical protein
MSNKFIGVGPEFGNECCICEGIGDNVTGTISLASPATPGEEFCLGGGVYAGCWNQVLATGTGQCINVGSTVVATCDGDEVYFTITRIEDQTTSPGCARISPASDFGSPTCLTGCSGWYALCIDDSCQPSCTQAIPLYGGSGGPCFPYTCCPCPETGNYSATASIVVGGGCSFSASIDMAKDDGITICSGTNPASITSVPCYSNTDGSLGPYSGLPLPYEKFGKLSGTLCAASGGCSGTNIDLSLCCCETPAAQGPVKPGSSGECHMCNYQLTMEFLPIPGTAGSDIDDYCGCPTGVYDQKMLPSTSFNSSNTTFNAFNFVDGSCDPFYLEFEATGLYWNCDCCQGGDQEGVDNDVTITVTIT